MLAGIWSDRGPDGSTSYTRTTTADDPWVRHCFVAATVGNGVPYYCLSGRTPLEAWLIAWSFAPALALTWLAARRLVANVAAPSVSPVDGEWVFARDAREQAAFRASGGWHEHLRFATTAYSVQSIGRGGLYGIALIAAVAVAAGAHAAAGWALIAAAVHMVAFGFAYFAWAIRGTVGDRRHLRILFVMGATIGMFACGLLLVGVPL